LDATVIPRGHAARLQFGAFTLDLDRAELICGGALLTLRPKAFAMLSYLARHPQRVLAKDELLGAVWPDIVVTDDSISQCIGELRTALGDRGASLIKTVPRRGYLFDAAVGAEIAPAGEVGPAAAAPMAQQAASPAPLAPRPQLRWSWVAAGLAGVVVVAALAWGFNRPAIETRIGTALAEHRSLAVMPFADLSEPPAPHLAQAIDMDLTTDLGRLDDTRVMARASAAVLGTSANVDVKRAGRELDVRHLVTGSVKRDGEQLHITVQLMRTDTGALLWTERFDYVSAADWVAHRDVSGRIANVLDGRVLGAALERARLGPLSSVAVDRWMRGAYVLSRLKTHAEVLQARSEFEAALAAQPDSSHALAGLAATHVCEVLYHWAADRKSTLETAERLARKALEIDPHNQRAMMMLSNALNFNGRLEEAMAVTRRQLVANPNDADSNRDLAAVLYFSGRWEEALRQLEMPLKLNPLDRDNVWKIHSIAANSLIALHRYDEAIERARLAVDSPAGGHLHLASAEALRGNIDVARQHAAEALKRQPKYTIARQRASRGSTEPAFTTGLEHFFEGLRLAGLPDGQVASR
jgi:DNA-binding winged helix-turn-helix (wHTH) protein/TolB-like protein/tetratricopeptide (TPR) repeat protein